MGGASRVTAGGLNVTYLCEGNSARTPAGMPGLTSRLAEQLNRLTEEDFPLLENYAYNIFDHGREPFRLQMGRKAGKRELLYGGDSGYPLMLLYPGEALRREQRGAAADHPGVYPGRAGGSGRDGAGPADGAARSVPDDDKGELPTDRM